MLMFAGVRVQVITVVCMCVSVIEFSRVLGESLFWPAEMCSVVLFLDVCYIVENGEKLVYQSSLSVIAADIKPFQN